ncbi:MAG TPA: YkgJ family cysteine cluster protein [Nitrospira sp.]
MTTERFEIALNTPAGGLTTTLDVPTGFVPITAIVPVARRLGEEAMQLEERQAKDMGRSISCQMGCAACCRMMVPLSPPEAFALRDYVEQLPADRRNRIGTRVADTTSLLKRQGLLDQLHAVADTTTPIPDEQLDPINRAYYALRHPCPFLENELCSIYEARPAACRELLVTSPAELCENIADNPVQPLPVPMRIGTVLGLVWASLNNETPRLIPLPLALDWAEEHRKESAKTWTGSQLIDQMLDKMWRFLSQEFMNRRKAKDRG